jgi:hypothetical protein
MNGKGDKRRGMQITNNEFNNNFDQIFNKRNKAMPIKLKPSQKIKDKSTGKTKTEHFYLKSMTLEQLKDQIDNAKTLPKIKLKCIREIIKRNKDAK